jgi:hypothetical protein
MARKVNGKRVARKTMADQVAVIRVKAATDAEANAGRGKCVSRPGNCGEVVGAVAAMRVAVQEAPACVEAHMAAFERKLERKRPVAAAFLY